MEAVEVEAAEIEDTRRGDGRKKVLAKIADETCFKVLRVRMSNKHGLIGTNLFISNLTIDQNTY